MRAHLDLSARVIEGEDVRARLESLGPTRLCLEVQDVSPFTATLAPAQDRAVALGAPPDDEAPALGRTGIEEDQAASSVVDQIGKGAFEPKWVYDLNASAQAISASPGFEQLVSLAAVREVVPYEHQTRAVKTALRRMRGRALLCDEVGLGKTIEAGLIMMELIMRKLVRRVLILTPPSLVAQWQEEMRRKFSQDFVAHDDRAFRSKKADAWGAFDRIIASIHTAKSQANRAALERVEFDLIIVDEAHHLRNRNTVVWRFVNELKKRYILMLTATPVQNDLEELFNLITVLQPGQLSTAKGFRSRYVTRGDRLKPQNVHELRRLLSDVMIRNRRADSEIRFTRRYARTVRVELTSEESQLYADITGFVRRQLQAGSGLTRLALQTLQQEVGSSTYALSHTLRRMAERSSAEEERSSFAAFAARASAIDENAKARLLLDLVQSYGDKLIVFTRFLETQRYLRDHLGEHGVAVELFHGGLNRLEKEANVARFRESSQVLLSTESGGEGRNLQFCNAIVNYDLPWNPMQIEQRVGRISRVGQTRDVYIFNLSADRTIESYVLDVLDAKINMFEMVIGEVDMILGNLEDKNDFEAIILDILAESETDADLQRRIDELGSKLMDAKQAHLRQQRYDDELFADQFKPEA